MSGERPSRGGGWRASRPHSVRRALAKGAWPVLVTILFLAVLVIAVFPTQTYLDQRSEADRKRHELEEIEQMNTELEARVAELQDPKHLELLARERFGLVRPGDEAYAIVPDSDPGR